MKSELFAKRLSIENDLSRGESAEVAQQTFRLRIRLDFRAGGKRGRFFGGRDVEHQAEEVREHQVSLLRNVPLQGLNIEDIDVAMSVYTLREDGDAGEVAYAPIVLTVSTNEPETVLRLIMREEFRKVEVLEPEEFCMGRQQVERLLFRIHEQVLAWQHNLEKRYGGR